MPTPKPTKVCCKLPTKPLSVTLVADMLDLHRNTVRAMLKDGRLKDTFLKTILEYKYGF